MFVCTKTKDGKWAIRPAYIGFIQNNYLRRFLCIGFSPVTWCVTVIFNLLRLTFVLVLLVFHVCGQFWLSFYVPTKGILTNWREIWDNPRSKQTEQLKAIKLLTTGAELISKERQRQIEKGFTAESDDDYDNQLVNAANCYLFISDSNTTIRAQLRAKPYFLWPWDAKYWRPGTDDSIKSRIRELTKSGALVAAEIDRLNRKAIKEN